MASPSRLSCSPSSSSFMTIPCLFVKGFVRTGCYLPSAEDLFSFSRVSTFKFQVFNNNANAAQRQIDKPNPNYKIKIISTPYRGLPRPGQRPRIPSRLWPRRCCQFGPFRTSVESMSSNVEEGFASWKKPGLATLFNGMSKITLINVTLLGSMETTAITLNVPCGGVTFGERE